MSKLKDNEIRKLDTKLGDQLRRGQVITKITDIVRELVDNAIDSDASSVQVFLDNFGLKKIQVKDSGHGIPANDVSKIVKGGHTSKLQDSNHLSCSDQYGFRGEGLSAICFFNDVSITTKTAEDSTGRKYIIGNSGEILKESLVASGNGTNIIVTNLFSKFPVRRQYISETKVCKNELKEIESYLKAISIANHQIYFALNHNGSNIWTKPATKTTNQALSTVLGVNIANKLSKCQSIAFELEQNENGSSSTTISNVGKFDLFIPTPPVDMKNLGFTSNKMLLIYVNRRRVSIREFENLIKRYAIGASEIPTQAEQRKYPVAAMLIDLPPSEVDFNRDLDKSKVFITCRELIRDKLEEALQSFYGINLSSIEDDRSTLEKSGIEEEHYEEENEIPTTPNISLEKNNDKTDRNILTHDDKNSTEVILGKSPPTIFVPLISTPQSTPEKRRENIRNFMGDLINSSGSKGEIKSLATIAVKHITPKKMNIIEHNNDTITTTNDNVNNDNEVPLKEMNTTKSLQELPIANFDDNIILPPNYRVVNLDDTNDNDNISITSTGNTSSNFNISTDDIIIDDLLTCSTQDDTLKNIVESCKLNDDDNMDTTNKNKNVTNINTNFPPPQAIQPPRNSKSDKVLLLGFSRPTSPAITVNGPRVNNEDVDSSFHKNSSTCSTPGNRSLIYSTPRPSKKLKLFDRPYDANCSQSSSSTGPRQVTLDSMRNWQAQPKPSMKSLHGSHLKNMSSTSSINRLQNKKNNKSHSSSADGSFDEDIEITDELIPATKSYLENKRRRRDSTISSDESEMEITEASVHNELDESLLFTQFSSTLNLTASISLKHVTNETISNALQIVSPENNEDITPEAKLISRVKNTNMFLINVRGNLGFFNPTEVLRLLPQIRVESDIMEVSDTTQLSETSANTILQEFMQCAETMDTDCTAQVFYFLANLNEYNDSG